MLKDLIVSLLIVLVVLCVLNSLGIMFGQVQGYQPYPWPVGVNESIKESGFGTKRDEIIYPEINFVDKSRSVLFMTTIDDGKDRSNAEFPLGANN